MRIFIDTNILIDMLDDRRENHNAVMLLLSQDCIEIFATADSILTMRYIFKKIENSEIVESLLSFFDMINIVDTTSKAVKEALDLSLTTGEKDIENLAKIITARDLGCEMLITNDDELITVGDEVALIKIEDALNALGYKKDLFGNWKNELKENERKKILRKKLEEIGESASIEEIETILNELALLSNLTIKIHKKSKTKMDLFLGE